MPPTPSLSGTEAPPSQAPADSATTEPVDLSTSSPFSIHRAVYARRAEYTQPSRIRVKVGTWNVAACPGTDKDLAHWFVGGNGIDTKLASVGLSSANSAIETASGAGAGRGPPHIVGGASIGLYVLGLQEIVDLNAATPYMSHVYTTDNGAVGKWKAALGSALPPGYQLVASESLFGLLLLIYAAPAVASAISNVSTVGVGTGLLGYLGNKGGVAARILLGEATRIVFVNSHLASGDDYTDRRVWDAQQILSRAIFKPISVSGATDDENEKIGDEDFAVWLGDLNFRLDGLPADDIRRLLLLHTRGEYNLDTNTSMGREDSLGGEAVVVHRPSSESNAADREDGATPSTTIVADTASTDGESATTFLSLSDRPYQGTAAETENSSITIPDPDESHINPHEDPASLQATLDSLLPHDQLRRVMRERKVFHDGWREGPITFLPSYKYDIGTISLYDSSEKQRAPSWCDRILYRTRTDREVWQRKLDEEEEARRKDEEMKASGVEDAVDDDEVLFNLYDPENDGEDGLGPTESSGLDYDEYDDADPITQNGKLAHHGLPNKATAHAQEDRMHLEIYTAHQRVTSSDHKPVVSVFTINYDAVVPELKARVHAEVVREFDRAENEGRPGITIVVDSHSHLQPDQSQPHGSAYDSFTDHAIDFGEVHWMRQQAASLTIANTGRVPATFSFVEKPRSEQDPEPLPESLKHAGVPHWLTTRFARSDTILHGALGNGREIGEDFHEEGQHHAGHAQASDLGSEVTLEPGETVRALVELLVDDVAHARALNEGLPGASLEDVLLLRVSEGRDHFVPVRATWVPTCIGRSVDELIRVPDGGVRAFARELAERKSQSQNGDRGSNSSRNMSPSSSLSSHFSSISIPSDGDVHSAAPKELFRLLEAAESLTERVHADEEMLGTMVHARTGGEPGWPFEGPDLDVLGVPSKPPAPRHRKSSDAARVNAAADEAWKKRCRLRRHVAAIIDALDRDRPVSEAFVAATSSNPDRLIEATAPAERLEAVAAALLLFLRGLTDGIVPAPLWGRVEQAAAEVPIPTLQHPSNAASSSPAALALAAVTGRNPAAGPPLDDDRGAVLDVLAAEPNHNIAFVFLTTTLGRMLAELVPLSKAELGVLAGSYAPVRNGNGAKGIGAGTTGAPSASASPSSSSAPASAAASAARTIGGAIGRMPLRSLSFRRSMLPTTAATTPRPTPTTTAPAPQAASGSDATTTVVHAAKVPDPAAVKAAKAAVERRITRVRRLAAMFGPVVCRALGDGVVGGGGGANGASGGVLSKKEKERRRQVEERQRAMVELFLCRRGDG